MYLSIIAIITTNMSYIKVSNPEPKEIILNYKSQDYTIGANETKSFPEDVAKWWVYIYGFMTLSAMDKSRDIPAVEVKETKEEVASEEEVAEEVEEKPKTKKQTKK